MLVDLEQWELVGLEDDGLLSSMGEQTFGGTRFGTGILLNELTNTLAHIS